MLNETMQYICGRRLYYHAIAYTVEAFEHPLKKKPTQNEKTQESR